MDTSEVANLDKAKNNVEAFTHELLEKILQNKKTEVA
jgi:hypothetical protein